MTGQAVLAFSVRAQADGALDLEVYDEIGEGWGGEGVTAKSILQKLSAAGKLNTIRMRINSLGGNVFDGLAIYNLIRDRADKGTAVEVDVDGIAASAASIVAAGGTTIRLAANAFMMIHNSWNITAGNAEELEKHAEVLRKIDVSMARTYAECSARRGKNVTEARFAELMSAETWLTAEQAVELGLADAVAPAMRAAACLRPEDAARFRNVPRNLITAAAEPPQQPPPEAHETMSTKLIEALGAKTEEEALQIAAKAISTITAAESAVATVEELTKVTGQPVASALAVVQAWKVGSERLPEVEAELATVKAELLARDTAAAAARLDATVKAGLEAGKLTAALEPWARAQTVEALDAYLAVAPVLVPGAGKATVTEPSRDPSALTPEEQRVCAAQGIDPVQFAAEKAARLSTPADDD
jgi:ATP-dependent protease ClpP protease subunit